MNVHKHKYNKLILSADMMGILPNTLASVHSASEIHVVYDALMIFAVSRAYISEYVRGKTWYLYIPLWLFGVYIFVKLLGFNILAGLPVVLLIPYSFNFALHEIAHIITAILPSVITASAGSLSELLLGAVLVAGAFYFHNYFASMFCLLWLDLSCQSAGSYMADAVPQQMSLVSLGGALSGQDPVHDWFFTFNKLHLLGASSLIGDSVRVIGHIAGMTGIAFAAWLIYKMAAFASLQNTGTHSLSQSAKRQHTVATLVALRGSQPIYPTPSRGNLAEHHDPRLDEAENESTTKPLYPKNKTYPPRANRTQ